MEINQALIESAIIEQAVDQIVDSNGLMAQVRTAVDARIDKLFKEQADAQINEAVTVAIRAGFDHEYHRVSSFGEKASGPTTIRKELEKVISDYWNTMVDKNGKPSTGYGDKTTRAEWVMSRLVADDFNAQMKQHVVNVAGGLKDELRRSLHETVNGLLSTVFKVKSADDQTLARTGDACIQPEAK
jgi:hypothetical protein